VAYDSQHKREPADSVAGIGTPLVRERHACGLAVGKGLRCRVCTCKQVRAY